MRFVDDAVVDISRSMDCAIHEIYRFAIEIRSIDEVAVIVDNITWR